LPRSFSKGPRDPDATRREADAEIAAGQALEDADDAVGAEKRFRAAIALAPQYPRAHLNLGNALKKQERYEEAEAAHRAALGHDETYVPAWFNLGTVLIDRNLWAQARDVFERVLAMQPDLADAAVFLAMTYEGEGDLERACAQLERALAIRPDLAGAWSNLGMLLMERRMREAAEGAFRRTLEIDPDNAVAHAALGQMDVDRGRLKEATASLQRAMARMPDNRIFWSVYLFSLNLRDDIDAAAIAREHFRYGKLAREWAGAPAKVTRSGRGDRLRVGYVSGDLFLHPVAWFLLPILRDHDRAAVETFCYSSGHVDAMTERIQAAAHQWRHIARWSDERVWELIREDRIDVLIDLSGHTTRHRLEVFARRAAPVQAAWLGYLNTTGIDTMDFRIIDRHTDPPGETDDFNVERLARMPHSQWAYAPYSRDLPTVEQPRTAGEPLVFGSFNQTSKLSDACLDLWARVLVRVPHARLRVHAVTDETGRLDLLARLAARGVGPERVDSVGRLATGEYLNAIARADIALDAYPYNGGTTTCDTLFMGTPIVALRGPRAISRGTYSIASSAGLAELLAADADEWVEKNVRLATDAAGRLRLRQGLRARFAASPVMDTARFARDLEALYREMIRLKGA
jgi:predicted O-linked N-acetylglucosamine transferase (SPINDLY family)